MTSTGFYFFACMLIYESPKSLNHILQHNEDGALKDVALFLVSTVNCCHDGYMRERAILLLGNDRDTVQMSRYLNP